MKWCVKDIQKREDLEARKEWRDENHFKLAEVLLAENEERMIAIRWTNRWEREHTRLLNKQEKFFTHRLYQVLIK